MNYKKILFVIFVIASILILGKQLIFSKIKEINTDEIYYKAFEKNNKVFSATIPSKLDFCGENVPLNIYYVREGLERELLVNTFWHSNTMLMLKRAYRWFPVIEPILKNNGIPDDFKYLALIESSFLNVVSPANAAGFWQFVKATGQKYGLEISEEVDQRYDLEKATEAACKFIKSNYNYLNNNWTMAAAAYNMGEFGLKRAAEFQKKESYYDLYLNDETSRYIYRILAIKLIHKSPTKYGFYLRIKDLYPVIPYKLIVVDSSITNLVDFASSYNLSYKILKDFNPWLRSKQLTNKERKSYNIKIPLKGYDDYFSLFDEDSEKIFNDTIDINNL